MGLTADTIPYLRSGLREIAGLGPFRLTESAIIDGMAAERVTVRLGSAQLAKLDAMAQAAGISRSLV